MRLTFPIVLALVFTVLHAHETWLIPKEFTAKPGDTVELHLTSGMEFPKFDHPINLERVKVAQARVGDTKHDLKDLKKLDKTLRFQTTFDKPGLATLWIQLHPKTLELSDESVKEYFEEIRPPQSVIDTWKQLQGKEKWKETYTKQAKTWIAVGDTDKDDSWKTPVGSELELMTLTHPLKLKNGDKFTCRLLKEGKPYPGLSVGMMLEGTKDRVFQTADKNGEVTFDLKSTGRLLIYAVDLQRTKVNDGWTSQFTTMTSIVR